MYPPTDFPKPTPAFQVPIPVPTEDPDEGTQVCVQFSESYLSLVVGALLELTNQATWDTADPDEQLLAQNRAMTLIALFQTGGECVSTLQFRACSSPECGLEYSSDGGVTWTCIDLGSCITNIADERIAAWFDANRADGTIPGVGQAGGEGAPQPETCYDYYVELQANFQWLCPIAIDPTDTITISDVHGTWADTNVAPSWFCIDGHYFFVNSCQSGSRSDGTDPLTSVPHMQLVGAINGTFFDPLSGTYVVPGGPAGQQLTLQANDGDITDNMGSANFKVHICKGTCVGVDFTVSQAGWEVSADPIYSPAPGVWTSGQGFETVDTTQGGYSYTRCVINPTGVYSYHNPTIVISIHVTTLGNSNAVALSTNGGTTTQFFTTTGDHTLSFPITGDVTAIIINLSLSYLTTGGAGAITGVQICS